jgi:hypothetical protein
MRRDGATYRQIAEHYQLGSATTARRRLDPAARLDDRARTKSWKRTNPAQARRHQRLSDARGMREGRWGRCDRCDRGLSRSNAGRICGRCRGADKREASTCHTCGVVSPNRLVSGECLRCQGARKLARTQGIVDGWMAGLTYDEIAKRCDTTRGNVSVTLWALRRAGLPIPRTAERRQHKTRRVVVPQGAVAAGVEGRKVTDAG